MPRRLLLLVAVVAVGLVTAVGASRTSTVVDGAEVRCPDRVWTTALAGLTDGPDEQDPCSVDAQERLYAVAASLMGLVLISGLLSRRDPDA